MKIHYTHQPDPTKFSDPVVGLMKNRLDGRTDRSRGNNLLHSAPPLFSLRKTLSNFLLRQIYYRAIRGEFFGLQYRLAMNEGEIEIRYCLVITVGPPFLNSGLTNVHRQVTNLKCFCLTGTVRVACDVSSPDTGDLVTKCLTSSGDVI